MKSLLRFKVAYLVTLGISLMINLSFARMYSSNPALDFFSSVFVGASAFCFIADAFTDYTKKHWYGLDHFITPIIMIIAIYYVYITSGVGWQGEWIFITLEFYYPVLIVVVTILKLLVNALIMIKTKTFTRPKNDNSTSFYQAQSTTAKYKLGRWEHQ